MDEDRVHLDLGKRMRTAGQVGGQRDTQGFKLVFPSASRVIAQVLGAQMIANRHNASSAPTTNDMKLQAWRRLWVEYDTIPALHQ